MEEILASIRLIISDDAKRGPSERQEPHFRRPVMPREETPPMAAALPEEDVLDLTDELVFPVEQPSPAPEAPPPAAAVQSTEAPIQAEDFVPEDHAPEAEHTIPEDRAPETEHIAPEEEQPQRQETVSVAQPEPAPVVETPQPPAMEPVAPVRFEPPVVEAWQEPVQRPVARPKWSRRELPGAPFGAGIDGPRPLHEGRPPRQPQRNWAEDIQMPIPDMGPVSLISGGETEDRIKEQVREEKRRDEASVEAGADASPGSLGDKEATVAALAESLARSAASAMDSHELATAAEVDFTQIDGDRKAEVTESFANAIQMERAPAGRSPLPTLLDEVLRQDFMVESEPVSEPAEVSVEFDVSQSVEFEERPQSFAQQEYSPLQEEFPATEVAAEEETARFSEPLPSQAEFQEAPHPQPSYAPPPEAPPVQAQFVGASQPGLPLGGPRTLEDAVREMLRPLLVQWLNENMPRILESAIREEIATRGLLPKTDG
jgi:cell pole-organizing protein PopZ